LDSGGSESGKPFLGICLGAQLLARVLGAVVKPHPEGMTEIGYFPIFPTPAGESAFWQSVKVYHWHNEDLSCLRCSKASRRRDFPNQAFRYGENAYGLQFHPEITRNMLEDGQLKERIMLTLPGAQSR
jgi:GMP synthase (glutamine-hydrolysing)